MTNEPDVAPQVTLAELVTCAHDGPGLTVTGADPAGIVVSDIAHDSRMVRPGALFVCLPGSTTDGHEHAGEAVAAGAVALVVERPLGLGVPEIVVPDARVVMAHLAACLYRHPAASMTVVGVTGTNGKTTVAHLIADIFEAAGRRAATIGTLTGRYDTPTTPQSPELQRHLAELRAAGTEVVALEVSSHALVVHRVDALTVDLAVFTNLSRDHAELHPTMEEYFAAKARLFTPDHARRAVVNLDDPHGRLLRDASQIPTVGFAMAEVADLEMAGDHSTFTWEGQRVRLPLVGEANVANALAAATAARELGVDPSTIADGLGRARPIRGRFEPVEVDEPFEVLVDYAHTPDALAKLLESARQISGAGRVLVVFGCGGDKDRTKRAPMGEIASSLADRVVVTSDNPRSEPPEAIIAEIRAGMTATDHVTTEPDRRRAIAVALREAEPGDLVVVAGKGHETEQVIGATRVPFDDRLVVQEELAQMRGSGR